MLVVEAVVEKQQGQGEQHKPGERQKRGQELQQLPVEHNMTVLHTLELQIFVINSEKREILPANAGICRLTALELTPFSRISSANAETTQSEIKRRVFIIKPQTANVRKNQDTSDKLDDQLL